MGYKFSELYVANSRLYDWGSPRVAPDDSGSPRVAPNVRESA